MLRHTRDHIDGLPLHIVQRGHSRAACFKVDQASWFLREAASSNNVHRTAYDAYLEHGFPIASGVIEGACRGVVKDRMERSGMRWVISGARAMLDIRCI
jgi:hypothetical protein